MENTVKESRLNKELCGYLRSVRSEVNNDHKHALDVMINVISRIDRYTSKHDIALSCGGEWMYQSDAGQVDALKLVSDLLDILSEYAEDDEEWSEDDAE